MRLWDIRGDVHEQFNSGGGGDQLELVALSLDELNLEVVLL